MSQVATNTTTKRATAIMFDTKNDVSKQLREKMITLLNQTLADAIDLQSQAKQAHWNVKGPSFIALHELFDTIAGEVTVYVDDIAERVVQYGGVAEGTVSAVAHVTRLKKYPSDISDGTAHAEALSSAMAAFGKNVRAAIDTAASAGDADTADLFTGISRGIDKSLWFVEAHLQAKK